VQRRGDAAVLEYTHSFDGMKVASVGALEITRAELQAALAAITPAQRPGARSPPRRGCAATTSAQLEACGRSWSYHDEDGQRCSARRSRRLDRVGVYGPGGKAA
jgi:histidinol dehydrogenase